MYTRFVRPSILLILLVAAIVLPACDAVPSLSGSKPIVIISAPPSGSSYREGDEVAVQSSSADKNGISRVELTVDGAVVRNDTPPLPQTNYSLIQTWEAKAGSHTIIVRAYNTAGTASDPAAITITVNPAAATSASSSSAISSIVSSSASSSSAASSIVSSFSSSVTSSSSSVSSVVSSSASSASVSSVTSSVSSSCTDNAAYVADLTIPDGTSINAGQTFEKKWRISNNGNCPWGAGYQLVFVAGEAMTGSTVVIVPPTSPGSTVDVSVPMAAPAAPGAHVGSWKMRNASGISFGQTFTVKINVPAPASSSAAPSSPTCSGTPNIASFSASPATITMASTSSLTWGAVTNAEAVEIDNGIGGVATPGNVVVSPSSTTTYTMVARCGGTIVTKTATVTVVPKSSSFTFTVTSINPAIFFSVSSASASATNNGAIFCGSKSYTFKATVNTGGITNGTVTYQWMKSGDNAVGSDTALSASTNVSIAGGSSKELTYGPFTPSSGDKNGYVYLRISSPSVLNSNLVGYSCSSINTSIGPIITSFHISP